MQRPIIVNAARSIDTEGGVSNVAYALDNEFKALGYTTRTFTLENTGLPRLVPRNATLKKLWQWFEIIWASVIGTIILKLRYPQKKYFIISHNDFLYGQLYINHGLHKALVKKNGLFKMGLRNPIHFFIYGRESLRHFLNIHQSIICFSENERIELHKQYPSTDKKVDIIPNGIDLHRFSSSNPSPNDANNLKTGNTKLMLFVGYEFERKGLAYAIEALNYLPDHWQLLAVGGDGNQIENYKKISANLNVRHRVKFTGKRTDVEKLYPLADCFILPAKFEPWGLVAIEALACGTPVVMTEVGSSSEFLENGHNGYFCNQSASDIASKVLKSELLSKNNIVESVQKFAWCNVAKQYIKKINDLAK